MRSIVYMELYSFSSVDLTGGLKAQKGSKHQEIAEKELCDVKVCELKITNCDES